METSVEEMKKREEMVNSMCNCNSCPSYKAYGKEDDFIGYCFPSHGKSKNLAEHGCICGTCPIFSKMNFQTIYFCTRNIEEIQKAAIVKEGCQLHNHQVHQL